MVLYEATPDNGYFQLYKHDRERNRVSGLGTYHKTLRHNEVDPSKAILERRLFCHTFDAWQVSVTVAKIPHLATKFLDYRWYAQDVLLGHVNPSVKILLERDNIKMHAEHCPNRGKPEGCSQTLDGCNKTACTECAFRAVKATYSKELEATVLSGCENRVAFNPRTKAAYISCHKHRSLEVRFARNMTEDKAKDTQFLAAIIDTRGEGKRLEVQCLYAFTGQSRWVKAKTIQPAALKEHLKKLEDSMGRQAYVAMATAQSLIGGSVSDEFQVEGQPGKVTLLGDIIATSDDGCSVTIQWDDQEKETMLVTEVIIL